MSSAPSQRVRVELQWLCRCAVLCRLALCVPFESQSAHLQFSGSLANSLIFATAIISSWADELMAAAAAGRTTEAGPGASGDGATPGRDREGARWGLVWWQRQGKARACVGLL